MKEKHPVTKTRKRKKKQIVDIFGGGCVLCGYSKSMNALDFHHTNVSLKTAPPSSIIYQRSLTVAIQILQNEKVILVCKNCHAEIHEEKYDHVALEGMCREIIELECQQCHTQFHQIDSKRIQKFCSQDCFHLSRRKVSERPTRGELVKLVAKFNYSRVGRMFGVSDNAVRKWIKIV